MIYKKRVLILIFLTMLIRLFIANYLELGNDEVYYWTYALHLQMNYFDHPPIIALLLRLTTLNLHFQQEIFLRLGAILGAAAGTWLSYSIGTKIRNERTGWFAALLYNTCVYSSVIAGLFILPDSPQVVFWLLCIRLALAFVPQTNKAMPSLTTWVLWGLCTGLCIMCKVHGIFLWLGAGLYILVYNRQLLMQKGLYLSAIITAAVISPIFIWNWQNNFITWRYHSQRVAVHTISFDKDSFIQAITGQIAYNNPLNIIVIILAIIYIRKQQLLSAGITSMLLFLSLPLIITVTAAAMFNSVLPHWSGPGFITLQFIAAAYLDVKSTAACVVPKFVKYATGCIMFVISVGFLFISYYPGTIGSKNKNILGDGDFTLDLYGWQPMGDSIQNYINQPAVQPQIPANRTIVCNKWYPAAHIDYYIARTNQMQVIGVGNFTDLHQYVWLNQQRNNLKLGDSALCIVPSNYMIPMPDTYLPYFSTVRLLHTFQITREQAAVRYFNLYLLTGFKNTDEAHTLSIN